MVNNFPNFIFYYIILSFSFSWCYHVFWIMFMVHASYLRRRSKIREHNTTVIFKSIWFEIFTSWKIKNFQVCKTVILDHDVNLVKFFIRIFNVFSNFSFVISDRVRKVTDPARRYLNNSIPFLSSRVYTEYFSTKYCEERCAKLRLTKTKTKHTSTGILLTNIVIWERLMD